MSSSITTGFIVNGVGDLSTIFYPLSSGGISQTTPTGYLYNAGTTDNPNYQDLITLFAAYTSGTKSTTTNMISTPYGMDLNQIFQNINVPPYTINSTSNINFTEYDNNGYIGLVFDIGNDSTNQGTASITFTNVNNATVVIIGGGGGGGYGAAGGGGGGGTTILSNQTLSGTYSITVGNGGRGGYVITGDIYSYSDGIGGNDSSFNSYISYGGGGGGGSPNNTHGGGNGGNINSIYGGGGGGGGGGGTGTGNNNVNQGGIFGSNLSNSYQGSSGQSLQYTSGYSGVNGYNYAGSGGASYYSNNYIQILVPFLQNFPSHILVGGGGGGSGSGQYVIPNYVSGYAGNGDGGQYGYNSTNGENSISSISLCYGNGGGAGTGLGGNGGNGVVFIYW